MKMRAQVIKNRLGPPMRHADFELYFETGIDDEGSWLKVMKDHRLVKQAGAWYTIELKNGKSKKFQAANWIKLLQDKTFRESVLEIMECQVVRPEVENRESALETVVRSPNHTWALRTEKRIGNCPVNIKT